MLIIISCSGVTINVKFPLVFQHLYHLLQIRPYPLKIMFSINVINVSIPTFGIVAKFFDRRLCLVQVHPPWKTSNTLCKASKSTEVKWPQKSGQFLHLQLLLCVSETTSSTTGFLTWVYIKLGQIKSSQNGLTCCITNSNIRKSQR